MLNRFFDFLARSSGARRRYLTRGFGFRTQDEALRAARGWLLGGYTVRIVEAADGTWTLEAWEV